MIRMYIHRKKVTPIPFPRSLGYPPPPPAPVEKRRRTYGSMLIQMSQRLIHLRTNFGETWNRFVEDIINII